MSEIETKAPTTNEQRLLHEFKALPFHEKLLLGAASTVLLAVFLNGEVTLGELFSKWYGRLSLLGAVGTIVLVVTKAYGGIRFLPSRVHDQLLILCAALPMLGFLLDRLHNFFEFLALAAAVTMAYAGYRMVRRDGITFFKGD